jgi:hypothetical protein
MNELTIVTPCHRQHNLDKVFDSIQFEKITRWMIVYDPTKPVPIHQKFNHPKISEFHMDFSEPWSWCGNSQRDYALDKIQSGWIYFLDDDNIMHNGFWDIVSTVSLPYFYTFDMQKVNSDEINLTGNFIVQGLIDTSMFLIHKDHVKTTKWSSIKEGFFGDFLFIHTILNTNDTLHRYIPVKACYHNYIPKSISQDKNN